MRIVKINGRIKFLKTITLLEILNQALQYSKIENLRGNKVSSSQCLLHAIASRFPDTPVGEKEIISLFPWLKYRDGDKWWESSSPGIIERLLKGMISYYSDQRVRDTHSGWVAIITGMLVPIIMILSISIGEQKESDRELEEVKSTLHDLEYEVQYQSYKDSMRTIYDRLPKEVVREAEKNTEDHGYISIAEEFIMHKDRYLPVIYRLLPDHVYKSVKETLKGKPTQSDIASEYFDNKEFYDRIKPGTIKMRKK